MRMTISFHLGHARAEIGAFSSNLKQGRWNGCTFVGPDAAAVVAQIIARHRAQSSGRMIVDG